MARYVLRRLCLLIPIAWVIGTITFFALKLAPGSAVNFLLQMNRTPADIAALNRRLGLDRPILVQYVSWLNGLVHGNLGSSWATGQAISGQITALATPTFELIAAGLALSIAIAVPAALFVAPRQDRAADLAVRVAATGGVSLPTFWLGLLLVIVFAVKLRWLPSSGYVPFTTQPLQNLRYLVLPAVTLAAPLAGILVRMLRSSMIEALHAEHIRTAEAKGVPRKQLLLRHAFRCALIPSITVVGLQIGYLIVGTIILSQVFIWPSFGQYLLQGIYARDTPVVQAVVLVYALLFAVVNIGVDILYGILDPRVRQGAQA